jgi:hypothetical protein
MPGRLRLLPALKNPGFYLPVPQGCGKCVVTGAQLSF